MLAEGEFALVQEELEAALQLSGQPVKRGTMAHEHIVYMMLTDAAVQLEDVDGIDKNLALLEPLAEKDEHQPYLAIAHRARGTVLRLNGALAEAEEHLNKALDLFGQFDASWQIGRTQCELAELAMALTDHKKAYDHYMQAQEHFEKMQALPYLKRTREKLSAVESEM